MPIKISHAYNLKTTGWFVAKFESYFSFCVGWTVLLTIYMKTCLHFFVHDHLCTCSVVMQNVNIPAVLVPRIPVMLWTHI